MHDTILLSKISEKLKEICTNNNINKVNTFTVIQKNAIKFISPDIATCHECSEDIQKKGNSRFRDAFTNYTQCGLRYSII